MGPSYSIWTYNHKSKYLINRLDHFCDFLEILRKEVKVNQGIDSPQVSCGYNRGKMAFAILDEVDTYVYTLGLWSEGVLSFSSFKEGLASGPVLLALEPILMHEPAPNYKGITADLIASTYLE